MLLLPDQTEGNHPHIMIGGGKAGVLYVLDRDSLGGNTPGDNAVIQEIVDPSGASFYSTPAYFNGNIYYAQTGANLKQRKIEFDPAKNTYVSASAITSSLTGANRAGGIFISSNGDTNGVVWTMNNALFAFDANNVTNPIFSANTNSPTTGNQCATAKMSLPVEANGKVYLTCFDSVTNIGYLFVYGILPTPTGAPGTPTSVTAQAVSSTQIKVSWTNNGTNQNGSVINRLDGPTGRILSFANVQGTGTNFIDNELTPGTTYFYQVQATAAGGLQSNTSNVASATTFPQLAAPNLVAYWNMDDGSVKTQTSVCTGSTLTQPVVSDVTGNGHNGVSCGESAESLDNGTPGYINGGWLFHGTGALQVVDVPNTPDLQFAANQSFTLSAWVMPLVLNGKEQTIIAKSADQGAEYGIYINAANHWIARGPLGDLVGPPAVQNVWTNVTLVQDGTAGTRNFYVNGQLLASASGPAQAADGAGDFRMGDQSITGNVEGLRGRHR